MIKRVTYKKVKIAMPHCSSCGEVLTQVNSISDPYECSCGTWYFDHDLRQYTVK